MVFSMRKAARLAEAQRLLQEAFDRAKGDYRKAHQDRNIPKVEALVAEQFGFERFTLDFTASETLAFTIPVIPNFYDSLLPGYYDLEAGNRGVRFRNSSGKDAYVCVGVQLAHQVEWDAGQFMAVLLHEVGHNFHQTGLVGGTIKLLLWPLAWTTKKEMDENAIRARTDPEAIAAIRKMLAEAQKSRQAPEHTRMERKRTAVKGAIWGTLIFGVTAIVASAGFVVLIFIGAAALRAILMTAGEGFAAERFSDSFATAHGYGPELVQALGKITRDNVTFFSESQMKKDDVLAYNRMYNLVLLVLDPTDEHPQFSMRCKGMLNEMDKAHSEAETKASREFIARQIQTMKANIASVEKIERDRTALAGFRKGTDSIKSALGILALNPSGDLRGRSVDGSITKN